MELIWAVAAKQYATPQGSKHLIEKSQLWTFQAALCDWDPGLEAWTTLEPGRLRKYPRCKRCIRYKSKKRGT